MMKLFSTLIIAAIVITSGSAAIAGDITGKITFKGKAPENKKFEMDVMCGKLHKVDKHEMPFYVVAKEGGLKDVVVTLKGIKGKSTGKTAKPALLDQVGCFYTPYVSAVQTGQTINVRNSDALLHNVHTTPRTKGNPPKNIAQVFKGKVDKFSYNNAERFLRFKCDVHPWMFAYVTVEDHPYIAVSAADGTFTIKNVPAGEYEIEAIHRKLHPKLEGEVQKVKVTDKGAKANFTLNVP